MTKKSSSPNSPAPAPVPKAGGENWEDLFNHSLDLICIAGLDGYFRQLNPSWERVLGWSQAELLSRPVVDIIHPDDRARTLAARGELARGIPLISLENRYLCRDGSFRWLSWSSITKPNADTVFGVARDVTEQRRAAELDQMKNKFEATGVLARGLGHDYNNLLAVAIMNLEMIQMQGELNATQSRHLKKATSSLHSARQLTDQLISLTEEHEISREALDLKGLLTDAFSEAISQPDVIPEIEIDLDLWPAQINRLQFFQVIQGIVRNACDAMPQGGVLRLEASNGHGVRETNAPLPKPQPHLRIKIIDQGSGIPDHILPKVFDPYFSTKPRSTPKGMGMGLSVCHAIMQKHGGSISLKSTPGHGTTVECLFPAYIPAPAKIALS